MCIARLHHSNLHQHTERSDGGAAHSEEWWAQAKENQTRATAAGSFKDMNPWGKGFCARAPADGDEFTFEPVGVVWAVCPQATAHAWGCHSSSSHSRGGAVGRLNSRPHCLHPPSLAPAIGLHPACLVPLWSPPPLCSSTTSRVLACLLLLPLPLHTLCVTPSKQTAMCRPSSTASPRWSTWPCTTR